WRLAAALAAPALCAAPLALLPGACVDSLFQHLALPDLFLLVHRFPDEGMGIEAHLQVMTEMLNVFSVMLDHDGLAAVVAAVPFLAGLVMASAWIRQLAGPAAAALGTGLALTLTWTVWTFLGGKNDPAAAGIILAAVICLERGAHRPAALCWGVACAVKYNGFFLAVPATLWHEASRLRRRGRAWRPDPAWLGLLLLPLLPWMTENWLFRADPLWPNPFWPFDGYLDGRASREGLRLLMGPRPPAGRLLDGVARAWREAQPALLFALVPAVWFGRRLPPAWKRAVWRTAAALAFLALGVRFEAERLSLPCLLLLALLAGAPLGAALGGASRGVRALLLALLAALAWLQVAHGVAGAGIDPPEAARVLLGAETPAAYRARRLTTYAEAGAALDRLPGVRSVLLCGDNRRYRLHGRVRVDEAYGRSAAWALARDSADPARIAIRLRQRNVTHVVENFVTEEFPHPESAPFAWEAPQLRTWAAFVGRHLRPAALPVHVDHP
ncbi:MAG: hypothetical protein AAB368_02330, partial [bacterium]